MLLTSRGRLNFKSSLALLLEAILDAHSQDHIFLLLSEASLGKQGELTIADSVVVGARYNQPPLEGYEALRCLSQLVDCDFSIYKLDQKEPEPCPRNLQLSLALLVPRLGQLPDDIRALRVETDTPVSDPEIIGPYKGDQAEDGDQQEDNDRHEDSEDQWHHVPASRSRRKPQALAEVASNRTEYEPLAERARRELASTEPNDLEDQVENSRENRQALKHSFAGPWSALREIFGVAVRFALPAIVLLGCLKVGMSLLEKFSQNTKPEPSSRRATVQVKHLPVRLLRVHHGEIAPKVAEPVGATPAAQTSQETTSAVQPLDESKSSASHTVPRSGNRAERKTAVEARPSAVKAPPRRILHQATRTETETAPHRHAYQTIPSP